MNNMKYIINQIKQGGSVDLGALGVINVDGVRFNGDTLLSNTLDDYEEGVFTPSLTFGGGSSGLTYSYRSGSYVKIGNLVTVHGFFVISNLGSSSGAIAINNLPFFGASNAAYYSGQIGWAVNFANNDFKQIYSDGDLNRLYMRKGTVYCTNADMTNSTELMFSITYKTA